jgi:hypothetical protein
MVPKKKFFLLLIISILALIFSVKNVSAELPEIELPEKNTTVSSICPKSTSYFDFITEVSDWPLAHTLVPFTLYMYLRNFKTVWFLGSLWEVIERLMWNVSGSYVIFQSADAVCEESPSNSLLADLLCNLSMGCLLAWAFCYVFKVPDFYPKYRERNTKQYVSMEVYNNTPYNQRARRPPTPKTAYDHFIEFFTVESEAWYQVKYVVEMFLVSLPFMASGWYVSSVTATGVQIYPIGRIIITVGYPLMLAVTSLFNRSTTYEKSLWENINSRHYLLIHIAWGLFVSIFSAVYIKAYYGFIYTLFETASALVVLVGILLIREIWIAFSKPLSRFERAQGAIKDVNSLMMTDEAEVYTGQSPLPPSDLSFTNRTLVRN